MHDLSDTVIGAIFVLISAVSRFNTPASSRSSTTALRYYVALLSYLGVGLALYCGLLAFPNIVADLSPGMVLPGAFKEISPAPLAALLLTVLLPRLSPLAEMDGWVLERLKTMGAIPHEARRLAGELRRAAFTVLPALQGEIRTRIIKQGGSAEDVVFGDGPALSCTWTKITALMVELEELENDSKFAGFMTRSQIEFEELKRRYHRLAPKIPLLRLAAEGSHRRGERLALHMQSEMNDESMELLKGIFDFLSRGLLQCTATYGARAAKVAQLGFDLHTVILKRKLSLDHLVHLLLVIMAVLLVSTTFLMPGSAISFGIQLYQALMVSIIYSAAVVCAVYPKETWKFSQRNYRNVRPVAFYFTAGLLAAASSLAIRLVFQLVVFHPVADAWLRFRLSTPWSLSTFAAAFSVAWMIDDRPTTRLIRGRLRWMEALAGSAGLALTAVLVVNWLVQVRERLDPGNHLHQAAPSLLRALSTAVPIGFAIGYLIPTWYREVPRENALDAEVEAIDEPAAVRA